jgi:hypothetical protein
VGGGEGVAACVRREGQSEGNAKCLSGAGPHVAGIMCWLALWVCWGHAFDTGGQCPPTPKETYGVSFVAGCVCGQAVCAAWQLARGWAGTVHRTR